MSQCLEFNPCFRYSATECISSSCFDFCRDKDTQKSGKVKFILDIDSEDAFNYDTGKSEKYSFRDYQNMIKIEIDNSENLKT